MTNNALVITQLSVAIEEMALLHNIDLILGVGQTHVLMGPNGSGKSSLLYALMGHPRYAITHGSILLDGVDMTHQSPELRARAGIFLACQQPVSLPGVRVFDFLREAKRALTGSIIDSDELYDELCAYMDLLGIDHAFAHRDVHDGFSGGEKKRFELLQLLMLKPRYALLDEIDSGLDVAGRKLIATALSLAREQNPDVMVLLVTHYQETIDLLPVDHVWHMAHGTIQTAAQLIMPSAHQTRV